MIIKRNCLFTPKQKNRRLHIHLPEGYFDTDERYPVMYFFDGHNLFEDSEATYGKSWGLETFLNGWDKPMLLVGVECGHEGNERLSEYLPYPGRSGWFSEFEAAGEDTLRWMVEELKPAIDAEFRTMPFRECTGIGGSSMGGIMALYAAVKWNRWFSKAACLSSAIGCNRPALLRDIRTCPISPDTRVYLSWGTREARGAKDPMKEDTSSYAYRDNRAAANALEKRGASPRLYCQLGGAHCEADWEKQVPLFMDFLWK